MTVTGSSTRRLNRQTPTGRGDVRDGSVVAAAETIGAGQAPSTRTLGLTLCGSGPSIISMSDFHQQDLTGSHFEQVSLRGATFHQVYLNNASMQLVDFTGVQVRSALFNQSRLRGVELGDVESAAS